LPFLPERCLVLLAVEYGTKRDRGVTPWSDNLGGESLGNRTKGGGSPSNPGRLECNGGDVATAVAGAGVAEEEEDEEGPSSEPNLVRPRPPW
jgi:hypothetical protein